MRLSVWRAVGVPALFSGPVTDWYEVVTFGRSTGIPVPGARVLGCA
jgi:hypothetical protein